MLREIIDTLIDVEECLSDKEEKMRGLLMRCYVPATIAKYNVLNITKAGLNTSILVLGTVDLIKNRGVN